jgi:DNA-binding winged helix-turn-helix (wHTH) protein
MITLTNIRKGINKAIDVFNGHGKEDYHYNALIQTIYGRGFALVDGSAEYNNEMTQKRHNYRVVENYEEENERTVGYLSVTKYFLNGVDNPYEILAYVS